MTDIYEFYMEAVFDGYPKLPPETPESIIRQNWIGLVSNVDNEIECMYSYETAEKADFHHSFYFKPSHYQMEATGEASGFFIHFKDGSNAICGWKDNLTPEQIESIKRFFERKTKLYIKR